MIKKIKIIDNTVRTALCDTTVGVEYLVTTIAKGTKCPDGVVAMEDAISFIDDEGDWVSIFVDNTTGYEVVEKDSSMTNNNQVNWDEIPEDVEAVITFSALQPTYLKFVNNSLYQQGHRNNKYMHSSLDWNALMEEFGDRFHLRPSPITQPTPVTSESTQVESSEVEATTTPEFDWSSVDDDVEAVFLHGEGRGQWQQWYKTVDDNVMVKYLPDGAYKESGYDSIQERVNDAISSGAKFHIRPPTTTPPEVDMYNIFKSVESKPSILTILQEAQQSILKHHGVTGKVKFTVTCS